MIFAALGLVTATWMAVTLMVIAGVANGYLAIIVISSLQRMAPRNLVGRVMSLLMLAVFGLGPISQAIAGAVLQLSVSGLFAVAGAGLLIPGWLAFRNRSIWDFDVAVEPVPSEAAALV